MDGNVRPIELARLEAVNRSEASVAVSAEVLGMAERTGKIAFQHRVIKLEETRRERERLLAPGCIGEGGPSYRLLRTQVLRRLHASGATTLAVLSAAPGDGKTLTSINLAIAIAADLGHSALLIDLDLRNPSVHRRLGFEPDTGIEECLQQRRPVYEAMVKVAGYDRLTIVPACARVEQSSELLASQSMADLIQELRVRYANRILIFDLPPVLLADDALAFSRHVQAGLFVVAEGRTTRDDLTRSLNLLRDLPIVGTVLNHSSESGDAYY
jgi:protein-tyrosine kinase